MSQAEKVVAIMDDAAQRERSADVISLLGHNKPPEPTPFESSRDEIEGLFMEASNWCDGEGIKSQAEADQVGKLLDAIRQAEKRADERRATENAPFDAGKAEVQARYAPLIANTKSVRGKTILAVEACKGALQPWLKKLDDEKRAVAEAARKEADAKAEAAHAEMRAAQAASDLGAKAKAEEALQAAKQAEAIAKRAENDKATAKGGARAIGLVTSYQPEIVDLQAWAKHCWLTYPVEMRDFLGDLAERKVGAGLRNLPGVTVHTIKTAR